MRSDSMELKGLQVQLNRLVHYKDPVNLPADSPHAFIYYLTICNQSDRKVTLLGRKWVIKNEDGNTLVIEGDKIVGQTPKIEPGDEFSFNSYHVTGISGRAYGSFHGVDEYQNQIHVKVPMLEMVIPGNEA